MSKIKLLLDVVEDMRSLADSIQAVADAMVHNTPDIEEAAPAKVVPTAPAEKEITLEEVRAVLAEMSHAGKTEAIRNLLLKYGAPKLSSIDPKNYKALLADAEVL